MFTYLKVKSSQVMSTCQVNDVPWT